MRPEQIDPEEIRKQHNESHRHVTRVIIYDDDGNVLIGQRAAGIDIDCWSLFGGKPDSQEETLADCIARECREEAGVQLIKLRFYRYYRDTSASEADPWHAYVFLAQAVGMISLDPREIKAAHFLRPNELDQYPMAFNHRRIIHDFFEQRRELISR